MWILVLNDMRSSQIEIVNPRMWGESEEELKAFLESEEVEHYKDGPWGKVFKKGGPLEWCNKPFYGIDYPFKEFDLAKEIETTTSNLAAEYNELQGLPKVTASPL